MSLSTFLAGMVHAVLVLSFFAALVLWSIHEPPGGDR